ncbi:serine/threonine protein kinase [Myxococcaceae bacterium GXIMD 01537]
MNERYRLVRPLAAGGMAELFLGVVKGAEGFEKPVAIKRVLPHLARDPAIARMFVAEAKLSTHLQHQNIATVHDVGQGPEGLFLVMELVNGWDLGALLRHAARRGRRFPPHLAAFIGAQALAGLVHAYRRTDNGKPVMTAHRDISPSNLLVSREGEVKVTDFGIARLEGASHGTQPGTFKGKLPYAAPEQLKGAPATAASDQFSLGIVLYELLTGRHPFGDAGDPLAVAYAIPTQEPAPLTGVPAPLADIVLRALAKAPEARFPQPEMMGEALARYLARAGVPATSGTLATFLGELNMPPTLLELSQQEQGEDSPSNTYVPTSPAPGSFELAGEEQEQPWAPTPGGPELSSSGKLILPAQAAPAAPARPATQAYGPAPTQTPQWESLELDTTTSSLAEEVMAAQAPSQAPSVLDTPAQQLELAERSAREETTWEPEKRQGPWLKVALALVMVGTLAGAAWHFRTQLEESLRPGPRLRTSRVLTVHSEPSGAAVFIDGAELGTTPLVMDNIYPADKPIPVRVTLPGHKPWKGTFTGGQSATLEARLDKR